MTAYVSQPAAAFEEPLHLRAHHAKVGCCSQIVPGGANASDTPFAGSNTSAQVRKRPPSVCTSGASCATTSAAALDANDSSAASSASPAGAVRPTAPSKHKAAAVASRNTTDSNTCQRAHGARMEEVANDQDAQRAQAAATASSSNGGQGFSLEGKSIVRISPALLGSIGEAAASVTEGSLIVQFAGSCLRFNEDTEWHVTHAILSNSLAVSSHETRSRRNQQVDDVMRQRELTHIGWLRQASVSCPLSSLDLDTQRVYEEHLVDSFAAMLDMAHPEKGPIVYFYCLANPSAAATDASYNAFAAAHHVVLDTSVPFVIVEVSLEQAAGQQTTAAAEGKPLCASHKNLPGSNDTNTTGGEAQTHATFGRGGSQMPEDDIMSTSIL